MRPAIGLLRKMLEGIPWTREDITEAVKDVQAQGLRVISLNQAGSVPDVADLVVSDPTQAGVMAVMAVADTAKFDLMRQLKRRY